MATAARCACSAASAACPAALRRPDLLGQLGLLGLLGSGQHQRHPAQRFGSLLRVVDAGGRLLRSFGPPAPGKRFRHCSQRLGPLVRVVDAGGKVDSGLCAADAGPDGSDFGRDAGSFTFERSPSEG